MPRRAPTYDATRLEQMERELHAVNSDVASLRTDVKDASRRIKRKSGKPQPWCFSETLLHTVLILYYFGPYAPRLALPYLRITAEEKKWYAKTMKR